MAVDRFITPMLRDTTIAPVHPPRAPPAQADGARDEADAQKEPVLNEAARRRLAGVRRRRVAGMHVRPDAHRIQVQGNDFRRRRCCTDRSEQPRVGS